MVVSKVEFNDALQQINASYAKLVKRIEELEKATKKVEVSNGRTGKAKAA